MSKRRGYEIVDAVPGKWAEDGDLKYKRLTGRFWPPHWPRKPHDLEAVFYTMAAMRNDPRFAGVVREIEQLEFGSAAYLEFFDLIATFPHQGKSGGTKGSKHAHLIPRVLALIAEGKVKTAACKIALIETGQYQKDTVKGAASALARIIPAANGAP